MVPFTSRFQKDTEKVDSNSSTRQICKSIERDRSGHGHIQRRQGLGIASQRADGSRDEEE